MNLRLAVTYGQEHLASHPQSHVFDEAGGTIGRSTRRDWVIPDPDMVVSSLHAEIAFQDGRFLITDRSTNGVFINHAEDSLGKGNSAPLASGDTVLIGSYEILVEVMPDGAPEDLSALDSDAGSRQPWPFRDQSDVPQPVLPDDFKPQLGGDWDGLQGDHVPELDSAIADLGLIRPPAEPDTPDVEDDTDTSPSKPTLPWDFGSQAPEAQPQQTPSTPAAGPAASEHPNGRRHPAMGPDDPRGVAAAGGAGAAHRTARDEPPRVESPGTDSPGVGLAGIEPAGHALLRGYPRQDDDRTELQHPDAQSAPTPAPETSQGPEKSHGTAAPEMAAPEMAAQGMAPHEAPRGRPDPAPQVPRAHTTHGHGRQAAGQMQEPGLQPAPNPAADQAQLRAAVEHLLAGAGLSDMQVSTATAPELLRAAGELLALFAGGSAELLQTIGHIKNTFRIDQTQLQQADNNPLRWSVSPREATKRLLVPEDDGYLAPREAVLDAIASIKAHQIGTIRGMDSALKQFLQEQEPAELERGFERQGAPAPWANKKAWCWQQYAEYHRRLSASAQENALELLGGAFTTAYEQQVRIIREKGGR